MSTRATLDHRVRPAASEPQGALILFHGRGADEDDLYSLLDILDPERRLLGVTPRGPLALPPGGAHWYVVRQIGHPDAQTFVEMYRRVSTWLDALAQDTGIAPERTVLGGFSQGAVMSYALGLGSDRPRPAAILALSGFIPTVPGAGFIPTVPGFVLDLDRLLPPIAIGHGTHDPIITVDFARRAREVLTRAGADVLYRESPILHAIDPDFLRELVPWIRRVSAAMTARAKG